MKNFNTANDTEIWRAVVGSKGAYLVSNLGRVKSVPRRAAGGRHAVKERILSGKLNQGYPRVALCIDGRTANRYCHRLVMEAFVGPAPKGHEVRHLDGNRTNARLNNLAYGTHAENVADSKRHGTFRSGRGHLTKELAQQILLRNTDLAKDLAEEFGVSRHTIYAIRNGYWWKHLEKRPDGPFRKERLTKGQVQQILLHNAISAKELAEKFGIRRHTVYAIRNGRTWRHLPRPEGMGIEHGASLVT